MSALFWILIGALCMAACSGKEKETARKDHYRIDRSHLSDPDDFECSVCHRRFLKDVMICPYCGTRFTRRVTDEDEIDLELEELEDWDEEDEL